MPSPTQDDLFNALADDVYDRVKNGITQDVNTPEGIQTLTRKATAAEWAQAINLLKLCGFEVNGAKAGGPVANILEEIRKTNKVVKAPIVLDTPTEEGPRMRIDRAV